MCSKILKPSFPLNIFLEKTVKTRQQPKTQSTVKFSTTRTNTPEAQSGMPSKLRWSKRPWLWQIHVPSNLTIISGRHVRLKLPATGWGKKHRRGFLRRSFRKIKYLIGALTLLMAASNGYRPCEWWRATSCHRSYSRTRLFHLFFFFASMTPEQSDHELNWTTRQSRWIIYAGNLFPGGSGASFASAPATNVALKLRSPLTKR